MSTRVIIKRSEKIAVVSPRRHPKYARKILQETIKKETGINGGYEFWYNEELSSKNIMVYEILGFSARLL